MKKLLVILLLLFPVHGAWAEKFRLSCNVEITFKNYKVEIVDKKTATWMFDIDTTNKKVQVIDTPYVSGIGGRIKIDEFADMMIMFESKSTFAISHVNINRDSGNISSTTYKGIPGGGMETSEIIKAVGACEKTSRKKKF